MDMKILAVHERPPKGAKYTVHVTLSRRNLISLLTKLDWESSHCTVERETDAGYLIVTSEKDEAHYGSDREPGEMHPQTESEILDFPRNLY